jgi:hypothetical protein
MNARTSRIRIWAVAIGLGLICIPVGYGGYAVAQSMTDDGGAVTVDAGAEAVPLEDCPSDVIAVYKETGRAPDGFYPDCPSLDEARAYAQWVDEIRRVRVAAGLPADPVEQSGTAEAGT